jgi:hypothetical protein
VKWGDKYDHTYVEKLKEQCEQNCSVPFNFYCLTDNPTQPYDIQLPTYWDQYYLPEKNFFWAYRKYYMFRIDDDMHRHFQEIDGDKFLFLDLDVRIHQDLKYFFDLPMDKPWIVKGWWNNPDIVKQNFSKHKSTPLNSSVIRWDRGQLRKIWNEIDKNAEVIFYTYPSADNYFNHHWYNLWREDKSFFQTFPQGDIYSWYKGNVYPDDMEKHKLREDLKICLYNNSGYGEGESDDKLHKIYA